MQLMQHLRKEQTATLDVNRHTWTSMKKKIEWNVGVVAFHGPKRVPSEITDRLFDEPLNRLYKQADLASLWNTFDRLLDKTGETE